MRAISAVLLLCSLGPTYAQDAKRLSDFELVQVSIDGSVNLRAGPTTEAARVTRLPDGALVRLIICETALQLVQDEDWCEVEAIDGSREGWLAARFLFPFLGADPAVLESLAVQASETRPLPSSRFATGTLAPSQIVDVTIDVTEDSLLRVVLTGVDSLGVTIFDIDGTPLIRGEPGAELSVVFAEGGNAVVRVADMAGVGGDWRLDVFAD